MDYFPLFVDLKGRPVLVVGAGHVALRKIRLLLRCGAVVRIAAGRLHPKVAALHGAGRVEWAARSFSPELLDTAFLAVAATDDSDLNERVFQAAQSCRLLVNTVDDPARCNFIFPSIIDRNPLQIAISSSGKAPVLARLLRERLEALLPQGLGVMAQIAGQWRSRVKARLGNTAQRRRFWERLFASAAFRRLAESRRSREAGQLVWRHLAGEQPQSGEVALVGAGPGDAGLLTLKGLQRIQEADVVLYDALVSDAVLDLVRRDADKICVGKRPAAARFPRKKPTPVMFPKPLRANAWCGSRAATRSCSGEAARNWKPCAKRASRLKWCPASPPHWAPPPTPASRSPTATTRTARCSSPATAKSTPKRPTGLLWRRTGKRWWCIWARLRLPNFRAS